MKKTTKKQQTRDYLIKHKSITTWDAIQKFGNTRLASSIWDFIHKEKMKITKTNVTLKDRNGNSSTFTKYILQK